MSSLKKTNTPSIYEEEILKILEEHYGLIALEVRHNVTTTSAFCATIKCVHKGSSSEKYIICKAVNRDGLKFLDTNTVYGLRIQAKIMEHLLQNGIKCSKPVPTLKGDLYCETVHQDLQGHKVIVVLEYLPGKSLNFCDITLETLEETGEWMGHMQQALKTLDVDGAMWSPQMVEQNESGDEHLCHLHLLETQEQMRDQVEMFLSEWRKVLKEAVEKSGLGVVHPSGAPVNIISLEGQEGGSVKDKFGLIDFENCRCTLQVWTIATPLAVTSDLLLTSNTKFEEEEIWEKMLTGYNKVIKLSRIDLVTIHHIMCYMKLVVVIYCYRRQDADPEMFVKYFGGESVVIAEKSWKDFMSLRERGPDIVQKWLTLLNIQ